MDFLQYPETLGMAMTNNRQQPVDERERCTT
jgi:hypothetical protein